jgi:hypothetical protein
MVKGEFTRMIANWFLADFENILSVWKLDKDNLSCRMKFVQNVELDKTIKMFRKKLVHSD